MGMTQIKSKTLLPTDQNFKTAGRHITYVMTLVLNVFLTEMKEISSISKFNIALSKNVSPSRLIMSM